MTKKSLSGYGLVVLLPALALVLSGCGKSVSDLAGEKIAEKVAEKAMETASGGNADVNINNGNMKINTGDGNMEVGENVKLPANFPKDVYVVEGSIKQVITSEENDSFMVAVETDKSVSDLEKIYKDKLSSDGWKIAGTMNFGDSASVMAEKGDRSASVMIGKNEEDKGKSTAVISVNKKQ